MEDPCQKELARLNELASQSRFDIEEEHGEADDLLLEALRKLGRPDIAEAYLKLQSACGGFWYA